MADPIWPFSCPNSWTQKPRVSVVRTEVEAGIPKSRARYTRSYREIQASWVFETYDKLQEVEDFFRVDLSNGSLPFTMKHPIRGDTIRVRFREPPSVASDVNKKPTFSLEGNLEEVLT